MRYHLFGASGLRVSEVCLGAGSFGEPGWGANRDESRRIFDAYFDAGGRFVDVANTYAAGHSEEIVGEFSAGCRDELVIATKYTALTRPGDVNAWGNHRKNLRQSLTASLKRLRTDYVDVLWVHAWDQLTPLEEIVRALDDEVRAGRILCVGVSNTPAWAIARANTIAEWRGLTPFRGLQTEYSLVTRTSEHELIPMARHLGIAVLAWAPLGGGLLAGGYADQSRKTGTRYQLADIPPHRLAIAHSVVEIAKRYGYPEAAMSIAWLRQRPNPVIPILGARLASQLQDILSRIDLKLSMECIQDLDAASAPTPIMPGEFTETKAAAKFFHAGLRSLINGPDR